MAAALADLTVRLRCENLEQAKPWLRAVGELVECVALDLEHMGPGPRARIQARLDRVHESFPAFADSFGLETT